MLLVRCEWDWGVCSTPFKSLVRRSCWQQVAEEREGQELQDTQEPVCCWCDTKLPKTTHWKLSRGPWPASAVPRLVGCDPPGELEEGYPPPLSSMAQEEMSWKQGYAHGGARSKSLVNLWGGENCSGLWASGRPTTSAGLPTSVNGSDSSLPSPILTTVPMSELDLGNHRSTLLHPWWPCFVSSETKGKTSPCLISVVVGWLRFVQGPAVGCLNGVVVLFQTQDQIPWA